MNDCFLLSDRKVSFCEFESLLQEIPDCIVVPYEKSGVIQVWYKEKHIDFTSMQVSEFLCESDREFIESNSIRTIFLISCSKHSKCELDLLLSVLAISMTGWIGQDSEGFSPVRKL